MRKIKILICLVAVCFGQIEAQPFYGQLYYPTADDSVVLSSAWKTNNNIGYVMGAFKRISTAASKHFYICKTDGYGTFNNSSTDFQAWYEVTDTLDCTVLTSTRPTNFSGITVIETSDLGNGEAYAITGAHSTGVFFATLVVLGNVIQQYRWNFPYYPTNQHPKKPFIRESAASPGHYYICGDFDYEAYVIKVDATLPGAYSTPDWAFYYSNNR